MLLINLKQRTEVNENNIMKANASQNMKKLKISQSHRKECPSQTSFLRSKSNSTIYSKLQERRKKKIEDAYQLAQTRQHLDTPSKNSDFSDTQESLYSIERKKMAKKSKISLLKTSCLELNTSQNESKDDWIQCPTIEEDYINSYGPKRRTKIDLRGKKKLTRFESTPVIDL